MTQQKPKVKTHIAWWVKPYVKTLDFACFCMGTEADQAKKRKIIAKGVDWERVQ